MNERLSALILTMFLMSSLVVCGTLTADEGKNSKSGQMKFMAATDFRFSEIEIQPGLPETANPSDMGSPSDESAEFFWFQYGDESSRSVCLKFNTEEPDKLSVDTNRDQTFSEGESFDCTKEGIWFIDLAAEHGHLRFKTSKQSIRIRHDKASAKWFLATAGFRTGSANFNGEYRDAKLEDKNANGLWFDREDRLFVDFDGNGKISRLTERIPAQGMRKIRGTLYAIAGTVSGKQVSLSEVKGSGFLNPTIEFLDETATVTSVSGLLGSNTGIGIPIESIEQRVEVPLGDWHVENLKIEVTGKDGAFMFAFARSGNESLVTVADKETHDIDLLGQMSLSAVVSVQHENDKARLTLEPKLTTASGCFLVSSKSGKRSANDENRLVAYSDSPQGELESGSSGFC